MYGNTDAVLTVRTAHAGCVLTRGASGDCITRPANAGAHPRCSATTRGANTVSPGGLQSGHHPSKHMAPHATGALHAHTQLCNAPVCGTGARRRRAAGNTTPPQKQHTRWQFASMRATRARPRKRRGRARRPRRVADASPLPVEPCTNARSSAAGTRTGRAILDGPRMSTTTTSARRVCVPADARARGQTTAHSHAQQLRVRSGQRTHRVWLCAITRKKTARARRGWNAHMHVAGSLGACVGRRHERAGRTTPPTKAAHPLAAVVPEGGSRAAAPALRAAAPARGCCIPAPGRCADAL